ncbi:hypothetical protein N0V88_001557 [Collariella sp. IMI 366227]|nr:hypothetical protein N0V88_001557 [Collariella sp. IMI 366227]
MRNGPKLDVHQLTTVSRDHLEAAAGKKRIRKSEGGEVRESPSESTISSEVMPGTKQTSANFATLTSGKQLYSLKPSTFRKSFKKLSWSGEFL